jgi:hypothetical protein
VTFDQNSHGARALSVLGQAVRFLAWGVGFLVIFATGALIVAAMKVDVPAPAAQQAAEIPPRKCPPDISIPPRAADLPVDDIIGVRAGMTAEDATETLLCASEAYAIERVGTPSGPPMLSAKMSPETITLALYGPVGRERITTMWRDSFFDVGEGPSVAEVEARFAALYGAPHEKKSLPNEVKELIWAYGPDGKPLRTKAQRASKTYLQDAVGYLAAGFTSAACYSTAKLDPTEAPSWDERCGVTIRAQIDPEFTDKARVSRWRLVVYDQQVAARQAAPVSRPR